MATITSVQRVATASLYHHQQQLKQRRVAAAIAVAAVSRKAQQPALRIEPERRSAFRYCFERRSGTSCRYKFVIKRTACLQTYHDV